MNTPADKESLADQMLNIMYKHAQWYISPNPDSLTKDEAKAAILDHLQEHERLLLQDITVSFARMSDDEYAKYLLRLKNRTVERYKDGLAAPDTKQAPQQEEKQS